MDAAASALGLRLSDEDLAALEAPYRPHPVIGHEQPTPREIAGS